jgi:hypothetical protein
MVKDPVTGKWVQQEEGPNAPTTPLVVKSWIGGAGTSSRSDSSSRSSSSSSDVTRTVSINNTAPAVLGIKLTPANEEDAKRGVIVKAVSHRSSGARAGLKAGDEITHINGVDVRGGNGGPAAVGALFAQHNSLTFTLGGGGSNKENKTQRPCKYGAKCYQSNPAHLAQFSHPASSESGQGLSLWGGGRGGGGAGVNKEKGNNTAPAAFANYGAPHGGGNPAGADHATAAASLRLAQGGGSGPEKQEEGIGSKATLKPVHKQPTTQDAAAAPTLEDVDPITKMQTQILQQGSSGIQGIRRAFNVMDNGA